MKKQFRIAPTVAGVLILSLLLTNFLMSGTMRSINDAGEREALALLTENAVQMNSIIENQLINNWKQIDTISVGLERLEGRSVNEVVSYLRDASTEAYDMLLLSGEGSFLDKSGQQGIKQISNLHPAGWRLVLPARPFQPVWHYLR